MSLLRIFKYAQKSLGLEDELSLAYLFGLKLDKIPHLRDAEGRFQGVFFRALMFIRFLLINSKLRTKPFPRRGVLVFAGTDNQFNSLVNTVSELNKKGVSNSVLIGSGVSGKNRTLFDEAIEVAFSLRILVVAVSLFVLRAPKLYWKLKKQKRHVEIKLYFNSFCQSYAFLPYFLNVLLVGKPRLVVMSNDHNVPNRSLRLAAQMLGIKTLYMQHASVSDLFPPLEFDYALLDGRIAMETYTQCLQQIANENIRAHKNVKQCQVILSGQKKPVQLNENLSSQSMVGIAVNSLDEFESVALLMQKLVKAGEPCVVRTHPFQPPEFIEQLHGFIKNNALISWSNSREESLVAFFSKIKCVIAGNTSIHLEAALAGLPTFYTEMSEQVHLPDYYGYVKNGVSTLLANSFSLEDLEAAIKEKNNPERAQAIKNYSETYSTQWQNREGELSALAIHKILENKPLDEIFVAEQTDVYQAVFKLEQ